jgi:hypothetical protein
MLVKIRVQKQMTIFIQNTQYASPDSNTVIQNKSAARSQRKGPYYKNPKRRYFIISSAK